METCDNYVSELVSLTCAFEFCVLLVGALVAVLDAITELGDFEELQHVDRGIHLKYRENLQMHSLSLSFTK